VAGDMEKLREIFAFVCFAMGICSIILAVYQLWNEKFISAAGLGVAFAVCGIVVYLSQIKTFKVWQIEVELRETLDRAEEIMGKMRRLSAITSRVGYLTIAWGNRFDTPSASEKQAILDSVDQQMTELGVTPEERKAIVGPYVQLIGWDFYAMYVRILERYLQWRYEGVVSKINGGSNDPQHRATIDKWAPLLAAWRQKVLKDGLFARAKAGKVDEILREAFPEGLLDARETAAAEKIQTEIMQQFAASAAKGGYTKESAAYYDKYHDIGGWDLKIMETFGVNPSAVR